MAAAADEMDPLTQSITLLSSSGLAQTVSLATVDDDRLTIASTCIGYGAELGATLAMLAVVLTMTPRAKLWRRAGALINVAALANNAARVLLLALYFTSSWTRFYVLYGGDGGDADDIIGAVVTPADRAAAAASTALAVPQNILVMAALASQAWAMAGLWPPAPRWCLAAASGALVAAEVAFMAAAEAYSIAASVDPDDGGAAAAVSEHVWVRYCFLGLEVACVCWFCLLFIAKLVVHLWKHRSFLPSTKGLSAMDALVMTNGVLMLIPVFFAGLQYSWTSRFEAGSMLYTSVIVVLPLGTLVAQRIADPAAFDSDLSDSSTRMLMNNKNNGGGGDNDKFGAFAASSNKKKPLLSNSWDKSSRDGSSSSSNSSSNSPASGKQTGVTATVSSVRHHHHGCGNDKGEPLDLTDIELARIDRDLEAGIVRVDRSIQRSEEVL